MLSLRKTRIISIALLILLLVFIAGFYYITQRRIVDNLNGIVNQENERIHAWLRLFQQVNQAKSHFYEIVMERGSDVREIISSLELWDKELEKLKKSSYAIDRENAVSLKRAERKFKNAVFGYKREIESGYRGTAALEMDKIALITANEISDLSFRSAEDVFKFVGQRNHNILREIRGSNNILISMFILGAVLASIIIFIFGFTVSRAMALFIAGMNHLAEGDLNYRISGKLDKDIEKLSLVFNNMMDDLENSEEKIQKIYKVMDKVTGNLDEGIMLLSKDLKVLWANKKIGSTFGVNVQEISGKKCYNIIHNSKHPCAEQGKCPFKKASESKQPSATVQTLCSRKGVSFYAECILFPLIGEDGEIDEYIHIIRDISERVILEQKMENNISVLVATRLDLEKRMRELEKVHKITINRELRMVELKKRLAELESAANRKN